MTMTEAEVAALGSGLAARMSMDQLAEAFRLYSSIARSATHENFTPMSVVHQTFTNHIQRVLRMPAGGAQAGGSQQTGFEMELVSSPAAGAFFRAWPNHESTNAGRRQSWEIQSMEDLGNILNLQESPAGFGALMGKPMALAPGRLCHAGVLLCAPPFTAVWFQRPDSTTSLCIRFPIVLWTEADAVILPPDDANGIPFYVDPPGSPGLHRDTFKTWGRRVAGELVARGFPLSAAARAHLPVEYASDAESAISTDSML